MKQENKLNQPISQEELKSDYYLYWFDKKTEVIVDRESLFVPMSKIQKIFQTNDFIDGGFDVELKHVEEIQKLVAHPIDLARYDYQVGD